MQSPQEKSQLIDTTTVTMRRMRTSDIDHLMPIESVSFGSYHWSSDAFANELKNNLGRYYVLLNNPSDGDEKLIGYCGYWLIVDEAHITTIAVDPLLRGQSLGELQLINILDKMMSQSVKIATLEVRTGNISAQQMYYKYMFSTQGLRAKYYQDNAEDALILSTPNINSEAFRAMFKYNKQAFEKKHGPIPSLKG